MPQTAMSRAYIISDAELKKEADALHRAIKRDMDKFAALNISKEALANFKQLIDAFAHTSTDEELLDICKKATAEKDAAANILQRLLRSIHNIAELAYNGRGHYQLFGFEGLSELSDNDLCILAKKVYKLAYHLMPDLTPKGLTEEHLEALASFEGALGAKLHACNKAVENSNTETQKRIQLGNAVYAELMRLANVGKIIYKAGEEALYNFYAMTGSGESADKPQNGVADKRAMADKV
jgi:hypothetical protein